MHISLSTSIAYLPRWYEPAYEALQRLSTKQSTPMSQPWRSTNRLEMPSYLRFSACHSIKGINPKVSLPYKARADIYRTQKKSTYGISSTRTNPCAPLRLPAPLLYPPILQVASRKAQQIRPSPTSKVTAPALNSKVPTPRACVR